MLNRCNNLMGSVPLPDALDLTTPTSRALADLLAIFAECDVKYCGSEPRNGLAHVRHARDWADPSHAGLQPDQVR